MAKVFAIESFGIGRTHGHHSCCSIVVVPEFYLTVMDGMGEWKQVDVQDIIQEKSVKSALVWDDSKLYTVGFLTISIVAGKKDKKIYTGRFITYDRAIQSHNKHNYVTMEQDKLGNGLLKAP